MMKVCLPHILSYQVYYSTIDAQRFENHQEPEKVTCRLIDRQELSDSMASLACTS